MNNNTRDKALQTVRDLLNLANNDAAAEGEIRNAMKFATRLMEEHQISDEDVALGKTEETLLDLERAEFKQASAALGGSKLSVWENQVAWFVTELVGGVKFYIASQYEKNAIGGHVMTENGSHSYKPHFIFYGVAEDVELCKELYAEVAVTIATMARLRYGGVYRGAGREYCEGYANALYSKLQQEKRETQNKLEYNPETGTTGTALVVVARKEILEKKKELAESWLKNKAKVKLSSRGSIGTGSRIRDGEAREQGRSDGQKHNVSKERRKKLS